MDSAAGELRRKGQPVKLGPQPFRLLHLLATNPDRLVSREEIRAALWPEGIHVDFDQSLHFAIRQVREALGDEADQPQYVKTVPRRGYRFIAQVAPERSRFRALTDVSLQKALWTNIAELRVAEARRRRLLIAVAVLIVVLIALLAIRR
jgi:DNA-binding winged helix-turn-helix (wHTH) protein